MACLLAFSLGCSIPQLVYRKAGILLRYLNKNVMISGSTKDPDVEDGSTDCEHVADACSKLPASLSVHADLPGKFSL